MTLATALSAYATLNLLLVVAYLGLRAMRGRVSARSELRLHSLTLAAVAGITLASAAAPLRSGLEPAAEVWSSPRSDARVATAALPDPGTGVLRVSSRERGSGVDAETVALAFSFLFLGVLAYGAFRTGRDWRRLASLRHASYRIRRVGRVSVYVSDAISVPFSYRVPGRADVVIPQALAARPVDRRIAIAHELQHHRQRDTLWVYPMGLLRLVCAPNPCARLWSRLFSEVQEFAVDETLVDRKKVDSRQYARCLLEVAETALRPQPIPACATGMTFRIGRNLLKRRIESMLSTRKESRSTGVWAGGILIALMAATAFASHGLVQDRRVSLVEAERWAKNADPASDFPLVVNDLVLAQLNRYVGTPEGRESMRQALARMEAYRPAIEAKMRAYQVPTELLAVPIVESGYRNLEVRNERNWVAGIWMFIAPTARRYGLRVDEQVDERRNPELLTDAAMRYLKGDRLRFNDWPLAILSYNVGEKAVHEAIERTGSRDAWTLIRDGLRTDPDYLPRVMASVLILRNPAVLD